MELAVNGGANAVGATAFHLLSILVYKNKNCRIVPHVLK